MSKRGIVIQYAKEFLGKDYTQGKMLAIESQLASYDEDRLPEDIRGLIEMARGLADAIRGGFKYPH